MHVVLSYELMMEAEHQFMIKQGGGMSGAAAHRHLLVLTLLCSREMLECIAWSKPDSKTLDAPCMVSLRWTSFTRAHTQTYGPRVL